MNRGRGRGPGYEPGDQAAEDGGPEERRGHLRGALAMLAMSVAGLALFGALMGAGHLIAEDVGDVVGAFAVLVILLIVAEVWVVPGTGPPAGVPPDDDD